MIVSCSREGSCARSIVGCWDGQARTGLRDLPPRLRARMLAFRCKMYLLVSIMYCWLHLYFTSTHPPRGIQLLRRLTKIPATAVLHDNAQLRLDNKSNEQAHMRVLQAGEKRHLLAKGSGVAVIQNATPENFYGNRQAPKQGCRRGQRIGPQPLLNSACLNGKLFT